MSELSKTELIALVRETALRHDLDPDVVCGIVERETSWNPFAIRYEPAFLSRYVAPLYTAGKISATEAYARSFSWGLMQVMGQTARENGFTGIFLSELCDPQRGLDVGCTLFAKRMARAADTEAALLAWNGGGNPDYPEEVLAFAAEFHSRTGAGSPLKS